MFDNRSWVHFMDIRKYACTYVCVCIRKCIYRIIYIYIYLCVCVIICYKYIYIYCIWLCYIYVCVTLYNYIYIYGSRYTTHAIILPPVLRRTNLGQFAKEPRSPGRLCLGRWPPPGPPNRWSQGTGRRPPNLLKSRHFGQLDWSIYG